ncbi:RNA polymerase factor sigma-54 [Halobacteriovorax sp. GB3]|uniref:RNA polymerase factor sigma-54 n=1 Tax=Halobacteriovorax sp. GB3 TaxID=2719615 RepID=UPI00235FDC02|nr:RNA polymerase factor sigma-54 [Halobacteriovorax sp. GB3]MDD0853825.1 RNA polymerase factor sigma-54 [Halobacteriovorax sp. GB3]
MAVKISQGLKLKQTQSLMMTPQLQQAIKLLTLTHLEMTDLIASEMVENPMLEEAQPSDNDHQLDRLEKENVELKSENFDEPTLVNKENDDFDWQSYIEAYNSNSSQPSMVGPATNEDMPNYENIISRGMTLAEHLEWQLRMEELTEQEIDFAMKVIHEINDDGYLDVSFNEILAQSRDIERETAQEVLEIIQRLDPVGCATENLVDCLLAQARIMEERSPLLEKIIREHLDELKNQSHKKIAADLGVSEEQVRKTAELLHQFYPKPGRLVSPQDTHYVIPDIYVVQVGGEYVVQVNDDGVPRLRISQLYQSMLNKNETEADKEANRFVQDKLKSALWLIKSIHNRQKTIEKVSKSIVRQQQQFFKKGPKFLKPMTLKNIANEIGMHESTVSRVTTNKYMHTPIGVFELKYFFNSGLGGKDGGVDISSEVLKLKIKELVEAESPKKPLSDQKIADLLSRDEVKVARRTVAKYREMLGIPSSSKRKVK